MKVAMVILAAGSSTRMGVFKPLLPVGEESAVIHCVRGSKAAGVSEIIAITGYRNGDLEGELHTNAPEVRIVHNKKHQDGMFSSVCAGVSNLPDDISGFFLLPADCCAVSPKTLVTLMDRFEKTGKTSVMRPKLGEGSRGHPPLIPAGFIGEICSYSGKDGLKGLLRTLPAIELEIEDPGIRLDMDTPEDYAKLLTHLGLPTYPDCARSLEILSECGTPPDIVAHGREVAGLALEFACLMARSGARLNTELLESACLLHDIKRMEQNHAQVGRDFLLQMGYPAVAALVGAHMDLPEPVTTVGESELLYLADKLCRRGKVVKLEDTMREMSSKFAVEPEAFARAAIRIENAKTILNLLKEKYGCFEKLGI